MSRISVLALLCVSASSFAELTIDNIKNKETLRYSVTLIRGKADGYRVSVVNESNKRPDGKNQVLTFEGKYVTIVELVPGKNKLTVTSKGETKELELTYKPMKTDYKVNVVYITAKDGDTKYPSPFVDDDQDYKARLDTAAKLMQTFTAEQMNMLGYGRKTFNLDLDKDGKVKVQTVAYPLPVDELRKKDGGELWNMFYGWLDKQFPMSRNKNMAIMGFTSYDGATKKVYAHTALGGGGEALFGSSPLYTWPKNLNDVERAFTNDTLIDTSKSHDDSAYRSTFWGVAATTIGATLHETGHTFGFPHIDDPYDIMSRGFDHFNRFFTSYEPKSLRNKEIVKFNENERAHWAPFYAAQLSVHPWFQPDGVKGKDKGEPTIKVVDGNVVIAAKNSLVLVCCQQGDPVGKRWFKLVKGDYSTTIDELRKASSIEGAFTIRVFDKLGNMKDYEVK